MSSPCCIVADPVYLRDSASSHRLHFALRHVFAHQRIPFGKGSTMHFGNPPSSSYFQNDQTDTYTDAYVVPKLDVSFPHNP